MLNTKTKIGPVIIGALGTIKKRSEPSVAPRPPVGKRTTKDHNNEHCTHHSQSAGISHSDLFDT